MKERSIKLLPWALLVVLFGFCSQALAQGVAFTNASLKGTYYIPCACEGTPGKVTLNGVEYTVPYRTAGMGKVYFDGHGKVTLTQHDVYVDNGNDGRISHIVADEHQGNLNGPLAQRTGTYSVDSEGFGKIVWADGYSGCTDSDTFSLCPSLMITQANWTHATSVYLVIPNGVPGILIHVTASLR
jgi:hypothetical protein